MLNVTNLSVAFGRTEILHDLHFSAAPGEVMSIVGPNGSGKTTLLRAMTDDLPYSGNIALEGRDIRELKPWELADRRAVLPQASSLAFPFTVLEVVEIGLTHSRSGGYGSIPLQALNRVGLGHYAHRFFQELSGGEQQRVHLARVLSQVWEPVIDGRPRWLFLDEPVSALDIMHQLEVMQIVREFALAGGGVVAVMHDLNLTAMFSDKITVMNQGAILAAGTPEAVMTDATLSQAYDCSISVGSAPAAGAPFVLPQMAGQNA